MIIYLALLLIPAPSNLSTGYRVKRIVGGRKTEINRYPWQVYLEITERGREEEESRCGGSIISERFIVTAAHCLINSCGQFVRKVDVRVGAYDICEEDWIASRTVRPRDMFLHPGFNPKTYDNDIAVLRLKKPIRLGPKARSIALPPEDAIKDCQIPDTTTDYIEQLRNECREREHEDDVDDYDEEYYYNDEEENDEKVEEEDNEYREDEEYYDDTEDDEEEYEYYEDDVEAEEDAEVIYDYEYKDNCTTYYDGRWATVVGWGATYKFDGSCILRKASKRLYPNHDELCQDEEDYVLDEDKVCAYNPDWDADSCQGDSGSGLIVHSKHQPPVLVGIVSYGVDCGERDSPGIYARVQHFTRWIRETMRVEANITAQN